MNIADHFKYYHRLPEDLQNLILSKIRYHIGKDLETDIVNYKTSINKMGLCISRAYYFSLIFLIILSKTFLVKIYS